jgi:hypothetical protein
MDNKMLVKLDKIYDIISDEGRVSIYKGMKKLLQSEQNTQTKISKEIKEQFNVLPKDIKVYKIFYNVNKKWKPSKWIFGPFYINIDQLTLTKDLDLVQNPDDKGQTITYTVDEINDIGFKLNHVKKIIKAVKNKTISFVPGKKVTITDVLNSLK